MTIWKWWFRNANSRQNPYYIYLVSITGEFELVNVDIINCLCINFCSWCPTTVPSWLRTSFWQRSHSLRHGSVTLMTESSPNSERWSQNWSLSSRSKPCGWWWPSPRSFLHSLITLQIVKQGLWAHNHVWRWRLSKSEWIVQPFFPCLFTARVEQGSHG